MKKVRFDKFKNLYDPNVVYEDYFEAYYIRPFIHRYADFNSGETAKSALLSICAWLLITLGLAGVLMGLVGLLGPEVGFVSLTVVGGIWLLLSVVPLAAIVVRSTRNNGDKWNHNPRLLGIDIMMIAVCVLFFIFGLLMMITTLNSETLNPNAGYVEEDSVKTEEDSVWEEPIFTYQDAAPTVEEDTLRKETDSMTAIIEDSFDPTIETEATIVADSLSLIQ